MPPRLLLLLTLFSVSVALLLMQRHAFAEETGPTASTDAITLLSDQIERKQLDLKFDEKWGYLPSLLSALKIQASSQTLVFSKTSFQRDRIAPAHPRALYFNDDVYVGYVDGGRDIEIGTASGDPSDGASFYTQRSKKKSVPVLSARPTSACNVMADR